MNVQVNSPSWFFGVDASFEIIAAIIAFLVAFVAWKVYRITDERKQRTFSLSFLFLSIAMIIRACTDIIVENLIKWSPKLVQTLPTAPVEGMSRTAFIFITGYITHILLTISALLLLATVCYKIKDRAFIIMLFLLTLPAILISGSYFLSFYGLTFVLLLFITYSYYRNCIKLKRKKLCLLVTSGFGLITLAQPQFVLTAARILPESVRELMYVGGHATQIIGYLILLIALIKTRK